jgi:hypothetical protein
LPLTKADRGKAMSMLKREWLPEEWKCVFIFLSSPSRLRRQRLNESLHHRRELQYMLRLGRKAEIQAISSSSSTSQPSPSPSSTASTPSSSRIVEYVKSKIVVALSEKHQEQEGNLDMES